MSNFTVYPAIDLRHGLVVRLREGDPAQQTTFSEYPAEIADRWLRAGARWLHVVNLDGAFSESSTQNYQALREIITIARRYQACIQFGGGLRELQAIGAALELGVQCVILGTVLVEAPELAAHAIQEFGAERITAAIDARDGNVKVRGWQTASYQNALELAAWLARQGFTRLIVTDISRDGTGDGVNLPGLEPFLALPNLEVIGSGGVASLADLHAARQAGLSGVVVGRALYTGQIILSDWYSQAAQEPGL